MTCKFFTPPQSCQRGSPHNTIAVVTTQFNPDTGRDEVIGWNCPVEGQWPTESLDDIQSQCASFKADQPLLDAESGMDTETYYFEEDDEEK